MSAPLRVGVVCHPSLGGSGIVGSELAAGLARRGHRVHLLASAPPSRPLPAWERLFFHEVAPLDYPLFDPPPYELALASAIVDVATAQRLDLVHVHYAVPHSTSAYLAAQAMGPAAPRVVTTLHGTDVTRVGADRRHHPVLRLAVAASDGLTVPSVYLRDETRRILGFGDETDVAVIPNFVDTAHFAPPARRDRGRLGALFAAAGCDAGEDAGPILFHVSNFRPVKRVGDVVETLARLRRELPARLVLVGDGPDRPRAEERAHDLGVARSTCFLGKRADFAALLAHADVFLLPSETESFGVAALEALSAGVPVVGYRVGGLPEVVTGEVGRLVAPFDVAALAAAARAIVTDPARRERLGRAARRRAEDAFRLEPAIQRYEAYYRRVLAGTGRDARS